MPARPAAPTVRLTRTRFSGTGWRIRTIAAVAAIRDASTKKCQGRNPVDSVEVSELIIEFRLQLGVGGRVGVAAGRGRLRRSLAARPARGDADHGDEARRAEQIREQPGEPV